MTKENEDDPKDENNPQNEDYPKNEEDPKNKDVPKNEEKLLARVLFSKIIFKK